MKHNEICGNCIQVCQALVVELSKCSKESSNTSLHIGSCLSSVDQATKTMKILDKVIDSCSKHIDICTTNQCIDLCNYTIEMSNNLTHLCKNIQQHCPNPNGACAKFAEQAIAAAKLYINACRDCIEGGCTLQAM